MGQSLLYFGSEEQKADWLPQLAAGSVIGVVAFTEGQDMLPRAPRLRLEAGRLSGSKPAVVAGGIADGAVVLALGADGPVLALVDLSQRGVSRTLLETFRSEEHTSELQSLMRISYAVFCLKNKNKKTRKKSTNKQNIIIHKTR